MDGSGCNQYNFPYKNRPLMHGLCDLDLKDDDYRKDHDDGVHDDSVQQCFCFKIKSQTWELQLFCNVYRPPELAYLFKNKTYLYLL